MTHKLTILLFLFSITTAFSQCGFAYDYSFTNFTSEEIRNLKGDYQTITSEYFETSENFGRIINGKLKCKRRISFNRDKTIRQISEYNKDGEIKNFYKHNYSNGKIRSISEYREDGKLFAKTIFIWEQNQLREQRYLPDGTLNNQWFLRTLDSNGRMTKEEWKYHDEQYETNETFYHYDKINRIDSVRTENSLTEVKYNTLSNNFPIKVNTYNSGTNELKKEKSFRYNFEGDLVKEYKNGVLIKSYEYVYDEKNNWVKRTEFETEAEIPSEIIVREIVYYN